MRFKSFLFLLFMMVSACAATVTNIRVGENSYGVRIVVDITGKTAYKGVHDIFVDLERAK